MKSWIILMLGILAVAVGGGSSRAEIEFDISGQMRWRTELDRDNLDTLAATQTFSLLRSRLEVTARISENTTAMIQFQDSRMVGAHEASGSTLGFENVDLHQAYIRIDRLWAGGPGLKAGRFQVNLGNQRVFGSVGWSNTGRAWEGLSVWIDPDNITLAGYWLKKYEKNNKTLNLDYDIFGLTVDVAPLGAQFLAFYEYDAHLPSIQLGPSFYISGRRALKRFNLGAYASRQMVPFDFRMNVVYQFGQKQVWERSPYSPGIIDSEHDIAAYLITVEAGLSLKGPYKPRVAAGIDYASGDDNDDGRIENYDDLYYTGHKFRGYMDYFISPDKRGLMDLYVSGRLEELAGWTMRGDWHFFTTAVEYTDYRSVKTKDVGAEFDCVLRTKNISGITLDIGVSVFLPTESFVACDNRQSAYWAFGMIMADFE